MKSFLKKSASIALSLCLAFSLATLAFAQSEDDAETEKETPVITLDTVYDLAYSGNIDAKIADKRLEAFYKDVKDLDDKLESAWDSMSGGDPYSQIGGSMAVSSLASQQVSAEGKKMTQLSSELSKRQVALGGRSMLIAYYNAECKSEIISAEIGRITKEVEAAKKMSSLGFKTGLDVKSAEQSLGKLKSSQKELQDGISKLKTSLAVYLGISESKLSIGDFTGFTASEAKELFDGINYDADLKTATESSLTIEIQELKVKDNDGLKQQAESMALKKLNDQLPVDFEALYNSLSHASDSLGDAEKAFDVSLEGYEHTQLRYGFGLASKLDLERAKAQYLTETQNLEAAKLDFSTALYNYKAMLGGVWMNS